MKDYIDVNYIYGEIRLWCNSRKQDAVGVLVEAKSDELFFRKCFSKNTSFFSTDGFPNLLNVIIEIEKYNHTGLIGIIDADFRRISNEKVEYENVFMTDGHDIEMMSINSQAWDEVLNFHIDLDKLKKIEKDKRVTFKEYIFDLSRQIGCVRYLNKEQNLDLVFRTFNKGKPNFIDYHKFIAKDGLEIDFEKMLTIIENKSSKHNLFLDNPDLKIKLNKICEEEYELKEFCNGHDIINILAYSFKKAVSNKNISGTDIQNQFIIAYRYDDFKKTGLYKLLVNWEKDNTGFLLLRN